MKTRLNSCDLLHPGEPSEIRQYHHKGRSTKFDSCIECTRIAARLRYHGQPVPRPIEKINTPHYTPYGVLPSLTWAPPQL